MHIQHVHNALMQYISIMYSYTVCTQYALHSIEYTLHGTEYILHGTKYTLHNALMQTISIMCSYKILQLKLHSTDSKEHIQYSTKYFH